MLAWPAWAIFYKFVTKPVEGSLKKMTNVIFTAINVGAGVYRSRSSQGLMPVCFLNAVLKWEMEE